MLEGGRQIADRMRKVATVNGLFTLNKSSATTKSEKILRFQCKFLTDQDNDENRAKRSQRKRCYNFGLMSLKEESAPVLLDWLLCKRCRCLFHYWTRTFPGFGKPVFTLCSSGRSRAIQLRLGSWRLVWQQAPVSYFITLESINMTKNTFVSKLGPMRWRSSLFSWNLVMEIATLKYI